MMKPLLFAGAFSTVACAAGLATTGTFSAMRPSFSGIDASAPRYTTEDERLVSEIAGSILNIAAFADRFEAGEPFQVRNVAHGAAGSKFSVRRRAEVFTVEVGSHVWAPRAYGALARSFMADGAGLSISEDPVAARAGGAAKGAPASGDTIARENLRLSRLLQDHPRSAALHEQAALLLAVAAGQQAAADTDIRPLLCRMTAHLAIARALHGDVLSGDGQMAERLLAQLSDREAAIARTSEAAWIDGPVAFGAPPRLEIVPAGTLSPR
jgi:hypothetical protein